LIKKILTIVTIVLLSACAEMKTADKQMEAKPATAMVESAAETSAAKAASEAISSADAARKAAGEVGYEWRDTAKLIKQAKAAAAEKNYPLAVELANTAKKEGEDALAQYYEQKNAGMLN
jgi:hypothetical protein